MLIKQRTINTVEKDGNVALQVLVERRTIETVEKDGNVVKAAKENRSRERIESGTREISQTYQEKRDKAKRERRKAREERKLAQQQVEDMRVNLIQGEINSLYTKLSQKKDGQLMIKYLRKASEDQKKYMLPLLTQFENTQLKPEERTQLEAKIEEEYNLCFREFKWHLEEVQRMGFAIGTRLMQFYEISRQSVSDSFWYFWPWF
ncbi:hypothetical protein NP233_g6557 [Leucocoprinus birnbaumii]|uniref:Uncharacterized protein n=1 Tax=Leucocoprinus birnbaumii TaxID=56174 RepID=A0AAD5VQT3_9AGAR|nr:hypothetical protein NP233_g6557 [Leucocoprinus birnbaumii]